MARKESRRPGAVVRLWAALLSGLYPPRFRAGYGADLRRLLSERAADSRGRGIASLVWFMIANTAICMWDAAAEWLGVIKKDLPGSSALGLTLKALARRPGYVVPVLLTLSLGIGANTATFTVLNSVLLRPLPYPASERIVRVSPYDLERGSPGAFSLPDVRDWEQRASTVRALGAYQTLSSDLVYTGGSGAVELETAYVTAGFYGAMGAEPGLGRLPTAEEEYGDNRVVVVSDGFWRRGLGADPAVVGGTIPLSGEEYRVVGVMPPSFAFPSERVDVWAFITIIPASSAPFHIRDLRLLNVVARVADQASLEQVRSDLTAVAAGLARDYPESNERLTAARVEPLQDVVVGDAGPPLLMLTAAAGLILLITCANLANLALARETRRSHELMIRSALGASRLRRAGLSLVECLVLSVIAGGLGLLFAFVGTEALARSGGELLPRAHEITPDLRVAAFTLLVSLVTGTAVAFLASTYAGRSDLGDRLRRGGRAVAKGRARGFLIASQVSLSLVLLVGASLLIKSLESLRRVDIGFDADDLVVAEMTFASNRFPDRADYLPRFDATIAALAALPGARGVSSIRHFPFHGAGDWIQWTLPGDPEDAEGMRANLLQVGPGLFETMGIRWVDGADFDAADVASGRPVVVVSRSVATAAYPRERAVGRTLRIAGYDLEIVGVVADMRQDDLRSAPTGIVFVPNAYSPRRAAAFVVRTEPGARGMPEAVRAAMQRLDPQQPITELTEANDIVETQLARDRFVMRLFLLFAGIALVLCSVGVYAVVASGVSQRRREMGVRLALGAEPARIRALVVWQGMSPVVAGIAIGLAASLALSGALERILFSVDRFEPATYAGVAALLGMVGLIACWLPARGVTSNAMVHALADD